jgi:hypothetical protein
MPKKEETNSETCQCYWHRHCLTFRSSHSARYDLPCSNTKFIPNRITDALLRRTIIQYQRTEPFLLQTKCTFPARICLAMFTAPFGLKTKFHCCWVRGFHRKRVIHLIFLELRTCRETKSKEKEQWFAGKDSLARARVCARVRACVRVCVRRTRWPCGLRRRSAAAWLLESRIRIPQ